MATERRRKSKFDAAISSKFTRQYQTPFEDTTLNAATAARIRTERKLKAHEDAIERQRLKIEAEIQQIEETKRLIQRKKAREAKRVEARCLLAVSLIQMTIRRYLHRKHQQRKHAATRIASIWRMHIAQVSRSVLYWATVTINTTLSSAYHRRKRHRKACIIQRVIRKYLIEKERQQLQQIRYATAATTIQRVYRGYIVRETYLDVLDAIVRFQALCRGYLCREMYRKRLNEDNHVIEPAEPNEVNEVPGEPEDSTPSPPCQSPIPMQNNPFVIPNNKLLLPSLPSKPSPRATLEAIEQCITAPLNPKKQRERRKTIAVTLSPMPYRTVLVQKVESNSRRCQSASNQDEEEAKRILHEALRRKITLQQYEEKQRQMEQKIKQNQLEREALEQKCMLREDRRSRMIVKLERRRRSILVQREASLEKKREEMELIAMDREERLSRLAWKFLTRKSIPKPEPRSVPTNPYLRTHRPIAISNQEDPQPKKPRVPSHKVLKKKSKKKQIDAENERIIWELDQEFDDLVDETQLNGLMCQ